MLQRLRRVAGSAVELAEAEVAVGDEGAHPQLNGERQRLAVVGFDILGTTGRRDLAREVQSVSLAGPSPQLPAERQRISGVAAGLVDPPGRQSGRSRAQK